MLNQVPDTLQSLSKCYLNTHKHTHTHTQDMVMLFGFR